MSSSAGHWIPSPGTASGGMPPPPTVGPSPALPPYAAGPAQPYGMTMPSVTPPYGGVAGGATVSPPTRGQRSDREAGMDLVRVPGRLVPFTPRTLADTLDVTLTALRGGGGSVLVVVLAILLPEVLLREALTLRFTGPFTTDPVTTLEAPAAGFAWLILSTLVGLYLGLVISAAIVALLGARDRGLPLGVLGAMKIGFARSGATLGASVLAAIGIVPLAFVGLVIGMILAFVLPFVGLFLMIPVILFVPLLGYLVSFLLIAVAIEEGHGPWRTLVRTLSLIRRGFWRSLLVTLVLAVLLLAIIAGLFFAGFLLSTAMGELDWMLQVVGSGLFGAISTPLYASAGLVLHRDLRVKGEAYDLRLRARVLAGTG